MKDKILFRQEVIDSKKNRNFGVVSINTPLSYLFLLLPVMMFVIFTILFMVFFEYSEKFIVKGYINSNKGLVRIYPEKNGIIIKKYVEEGDKVEKGAPLFLMASSWKEWNEKKVSKIYHQLQRRKQMLEKEIAYKSKIRHSLKPLVQKHYMSAMDYHQKQEEILALEHSRHLVEMELIQYQQHNSWVIKAPVSGRISMIAVEEGQTILAAVSLMSILPANAEFVAELFIPVNQAGFLSKKNRVMIRYDAWPHESFGTYEAHVTRISQSVIRDDEEEKPLTVGQPYYKAVVQLESQFVKVYGKNRTLRQGMTLSAVIIGSRKKIWQWILDPLYRFYGELIV